MMQKFSMGMQRAGMTILLIVAVCGLLSGCSAARLAYENGESLSYWWFDGYLDFDATQRAVVKADIAEAFAWHRRSELPDYVDLLGSIQTRLQRSIVQGSQVTRTEIQADVDEVRRRLRRMTEHAAVPLAALAASLQPVQLARLQEKLAAKNSAYRKENLRGDVGQRQDRRFKKALQQAEYWFGDFDDQQEAAIRAASDARPLDPETVYEERLRRQTAMLALIRRIQTERPLPATAAALIAAFLDPANQHAAMPEKKAFFEAQQEGNIRLATVIVNLANPAQRASAIARVRQWRNDLAALSRD